MRKGTNRSTGIDYCKLFAGMAEIDTFHTVITLSPKMNGKYIKLYILYLLNGVWREC